MKRCELNPIRDSAVLPQKLAGHFDRWLCLFAEWGVKLCVVTCADIVFPKDEVHARFTIGTSVFVMTVIFVVV